MSRVPDVPGTENVAVTLCAALIVTWQVAVPEHAPPQPVNTPVVACAVSVTVLLVAKVAEQVAPQLMPAGWLVTVPAPLPWRVTDRSCVTAPCGENVAVTLLTKSIVTWQVA